MLRAYTLRVFCTLLALLFILSPVAAATTTDITLTQNSAAVSLDLSAGAALLLDANSGSVLYEQNAHTQMPMASTTKIMTALVVVEHLDVTQAVSIDKRAVGIEGSSIYLYEGEWLTVEQLLYALLLESANDAAVALAIATAGSIENFAALMNDKAQALGLENTHFDNPHGLDSETHYTTAYDLARIAAAALEHPVLKKIMSTKRMTIPLCDMNDPNVESTSTSGNTESIPVGTRVLLNHNKMLRYYDGAIGVKTGYTKKSGRCLVSAAERDGLTLVAVTLSAPDDWNDHTKLLDYGYNAYTRVILCSKGEYRTMVPTSGGKEQYVLVACKEDCSVTLPRNHSSITCTVELPHFVFAPVQAYKSMGRLIFYCDIDNDGQREEIAAAELCSLYRVDALPPPTLWERICSFFRSLFD